MNITGKRVLITGGSSGVSLALAQVLAAASGEPASLPSAQISGDAPPAFINRFGGLKIGVR